MRRTALTALLAVVAFTLIFGLAYPLAMTGVSQLLFPGNADGSRIAVGGRQDWFHGLEFQLSGHGRLHKPRH